MSDKQALALSKFAGTWCLSKRIQQPQLDDFVFTGHAEFCPTSAGLTYREYGELRAPDGRVMGAERSYIWRQGENNGIDVLFDDGRFFHRIVLDSPSALHLCGDDRYQVNYDFSAWPEWTSCWQVTGPNKDYSMESLYRRAN